MAERSIMCENAFFVGGAFIIADTFEIELACLALASPSLSTLTIEMSLSSLGECLPRHRSLTSNSDTIVRHPAGQENNNEEDEVAASDCCSVLFFPAIHLG